MSTKNILLDRLLHGSRVWSSASRALVPLLVAGVVSSCAATSGAPESRSRSQSTATASEGAPSGQVGASDPNATTGGSNGLIVPSGAAPSTVADTSPGVMGVASGADEPVIMDTCRASNATGLPEAEVQGLMAGGDPGALRWLYPYDGTVFPRGMIAPTLMWDGADGQVVYVHIQSTQFEYHGCLTATGPAQLQLPQAVWDAAGLKSGGPADPFTVELTVLSGSGPVGPIRQQMVIAQATIKGSLYYNSYSGVGAVYRIPPGGTAQPFLFGTGCYGCHTVSANGQRMLSSTGAGPGASYELTPTTQESPPILALAPGASFSGVSPDGTIYVETAHPDPIVRPQGMPTDALIINNATMYLTDTGAAIPDSGIPGGAMMPIFSPGGSLVAFTDFAESSGRGLAVMDFDQAARKMSNRRVVFTDTGESYPGWPFFLPDDKALVFSRGVNPQFSGAGAGVLPGLPLAGPASDLYIVDLASGVATLLAKAMGFADPQDTTGYTPFGAADQHQHYYPTVSPVAAGGYFWVFFDSIRHYGNQGLARQLWGSAIRISADGAYNGDPSHPAFYVTGQDFNTGNHRAFTALDPCRQDGDSCSSGIDCCGGFCYFEAPEELVEPVGTCSPREQMTECSRQDERCSAASDCCTDDPTAQQLTCIAGFCAVVRGPD